jgi:hypothetical protein
MFGTIPFAGAPFASAGGSSGTGQVNGVSAFGQVGTVVVSISDAIILTGVEATASVGSVKGIPKGTPLGVVGTGAVGTVKLYVNYTLTGVEGTGAVGTATTTTADIGAVTGVSAVGAVGTVLPIYNGNGITTGVVGTTNTPSVLPVMLPVLTGIVGTATVGSVTIRVNDGAIVVGVSATGSVGTVLIRGWTTINDAQAANWVLIDDGNTPS